MRRTLVVLAALLAPSTGHADLLSINVVRIDCSNCLKTYRIYAEFDDPADQVLAVTSKGPGGPIELIADRPLFNDGGVLDGLPQEDFATAPIGGPRDSWVTIGADTLIPNDTAYTPNFLGSDGTMAVITGQGFLDQSNGGWYDSNPGTPETGTSVLLAQFSFEEGFTMLSFGGNLTYVPASTGQLTTEGFWTWYGEDKFLCPADLDFDYVVGFTDLVLLLAAWGPCPDCCLADFDGNGAVEFDDLVVLLSTWGDC